MTTLMQLLTTFPYDYDQGQTVYAQKIAGRFAPHSQAVLANAQPDGMEVFDNIDPVDDFIEAAIMEGDPDKEIEDHEWEQAAKRLIKHINHKTHTVEVK